LDNQTPKPKPRKKAKVTERQRAARRQNIVEFNAANGGRPAALKSGIRGFIDTGNLPQVPGAEAIAEQVDLVVGQMVRDLGAVEAADLPAQKRGILESQRIALMVLGLANLFLRREGLLNKRGKPHPVLSTVVSFGNMLRLNGLALGLERKARKVGPTTLAEYLDENDSTIDPAVPSTGPIDEVAKP